MAQACMYTDFCIQITSNRKLKWNFKLKHETTDRNNYYFPFRRKAYYF